MIQLEFFRHVQVSSPIHIFNLPYVLLRGFGGAGRSGVGDGTRQDRAGQNRAGQDKVGQKVYFSSMHIQHIDINSNKFK